MDTAEPVAFVLTIVRSIPNVELVTDSVLLVLTDNVPVGEKTVEVKLTVPVKEILLLNVNVILLVVKFTSVVTVLGILIVIGLPDFIMVTLSPFTGCPVPGEVVQFASVFQFVVPAPPLHV